MACIEFDPAGIAAVVRVATPFTIGAVPMDAKFRTNAINPLASGGVISAVNVTLCPGDDGFTLDVRLLVVAPGCPTSFSTGDRLKLCVGSPPYTAVRTVVDEPKGAVQGSVATPFTTGAEPRNGP